jgi:hypothetical protein
VKEKLQGLPMLSPSIVSSLSLTPVRLEMLREITARDGINERLAVLTFKRGDIAWAERQGLIDLRQHRTGTRFHATEKGFAVIKTYVAVRFLRTVLGFERMRLAPSRS